MLNAGEHIGEDVPASALIRIKRGIGAGDGNRTHDIQLGKLTFYL